MSIIQNEAHVGNTVTGSKRAIAKDKGVEYIVHGARVKCTRGSVTTTMTATTNACVGNQLCIVDIDTSSVSFAGDFGICETLTALNGGEPTQCAMSNLPKWFNTNSAYMSGEHPHATTSSFAVCAVGAGAILPLADGQEKDEFDFRAFLEGLPEWMRGAFRGLAPACAFCGDPINMATGNFIYSKDDIEIPGAFPIMFKRFYN